MTQYKRFMVIVHTIDSPLTFIQHIIGHHSYTNIEGVDPDIDTGAAEVCNTTCELHYIIIDSNSK